MNYDKCKHQVTHRDMYNYLHVSCSKNPVKQILFIQDTSSPSSNSRTRSFRKRSSPTPQPETMSYASNIETL
uniref:SFRICE_039674 n=1 Tax=Spodoptera frugiperda TaxID=7108 RepID=A0A2H1WTT6_SPOFR